MLGYAIHRGMTIDEAEDVVADTFLVCWRRLDEVPDVSLAWLLGVARKTVANHRRSARRRGALEDLLARELPSRVSPSVVKEALRFAGTEIARALAELSEEDREVVLLTALDSLSAGEAARVVECSRSAFAVRAFRARSRLNKHLAEVRTYVSLESDGLNAEES